MQRRSQAPIPPMANDDPGDRAARITTRGGATPTVERAAAITPSRPKPTPHRATKRAPVAATPANHFSILAEDAGTTAPDLTDDDGGPVLGLDLPPPSTPTPNASARGWDSFLDSLAATKRGEIGVVDDILINYANFAGDEFRTFDRASAKSDARIAALEARLDNDIDDILETSVTLSDLKELAKANVQGLAVLRSMVTETTQSINAVSRKWDLMSSRVAEVKETADNAFRMASEVSPSIEVHKVRLDGLLDDVSRMSSDLDSLRASVRPPTDTSDKMTSLENTVSRMGVEFESIRALLADR